MTKISWRKLIVTILLWLSHSILLSIPLEKEPSLVLERAVANYVEIRFVHEVNTLTTED